ncbi:hypothetical protein H5410_026854 [Solanum commersonii]|uniref:Uncharacterized protein n=1 Tax=Solanum commersonii TaxID=4109 RepID=A0A9J5YY87_SOLCO|nr:hypothetical protein H5410_026854 [Solanum commersonii]
MRKRSMLLVPPMLDGRKKHQKGRKYLKKNEELLCDLTVSNALTSHSHSTTMASDDERKEQLIVRVDTTRQAVDILGRHLNRVNDNLVSFSPSLSYRISCTYSADLSRWNKTGAIIPNFGA